MAILSNINGKFAVDSTGAVQFSGAAGTSGYILKSNGAGSAPTWVDPSTVIGGPYLPLSGGTLTGATATASGISFTFGGTARFDGDMTLPAAADNFDIGSGLQTTGKIRFGDTSWNNSLGLESYWMVLRSNQNEGLKLIDSASKTYVQFNASNNSAGAYVSTFSGANTYNKIQSFYSGDYTSGWKFSDYNGGIWYDAGADDLTVNSGHANSQILFNSGGALALTLDASQNATFAGNTVTIDPASGDATLLLQSSTQTLRLDQNSIRTTTNSDITIFTNGNSNQLFLDQGTGNVGIGTTSPGRKLTVTGDVSGDANNLLLSNENDTDGDSASIGFSMLSNNTYVKSGIFFERTTTQGRGSLHLAVNNEVNGNNVTKTDAKLTINNSGNVGIGTTSPGARLHNYSTSTQNVWLSGYGTSAQNTWGAGHGIFAASDNGLLISKANAANDTNRLFSFYHDAGGNSEMYMYNTSMTNTVKIDSSGDSYFNGGNVGIGNTSPTYKLSVNHGAAGGNGITTVANFSAGTGNASGDGAQININSWGDNYGGFIRTVNTQGTPNYVNPKMEFGLNYNNYLPADMIKRMTLLGNGNFGIGVDTPSQSLEISGNMAIRDTHKIYFNHNTNTARYIGASSANDLDIAADDDINYRSNYNRFFNGSTEFARLSSSTNSWIANGSNGKLGINKTNPSYNLDVTGSIYCTNSYIRASTAPDVWYSNNNNGTYTQTVLYMNQNNTSNSDLNGYFFERGRISNSATAEIRRWVVGARGGQKQMVLDGPGTLTVAGDVVAYGSPSDISLKENIKPIKNPLGKIKKLKGVTFDWKQSNSILDIKEDYGFIAQDVKKIIPELVRKNKNELLSMRHQGIIPILVEAIKELEARVKELENK